MSVPQFNKDGSLYPNLLAATYSLVMYHHSFGNHLGHKNYEYTKLCNCSKKNKDFKSPRNKPLIVLDYWPENIEEYFRLCNPDNINLSEISTTQDVTDIINSMVKHVKSMEQGMIVLQDNFI